MAKLREGADPKAYQDMKKAQAEAQAQSDKRSGAGKPTPTAEECDLIKMGLLDLDGKEDDGSGPGMVRVTELREMQPAAAGPGYETRTVTAESGEHQERRRR